MKYVVPYTNNVYYTDDIHVYSTITNKVVDDNLNMEFFWGEGNRSVSPKKILVITRQNIKIPKELYRYINIVEMNTRGIFYDYYYYFDNLLSHPEYPGFYYIPYYTSYVINLFGEIIYLPSGKKYTHASNYRDINNKYYPMTSMVTDYHFSKKCGVRYNHRANTTIHRVKALTFLPYSANPFILDINHIDGNKSNHNVNNLEWCTRAHNNLHAHRTGLKKDSHSVVIFDYINDTVKEYYSISEAAREIGADDESVRYKLLKSQDTLIKGRYLVRYWDEGGFYNLPSKIDILKVNNIRHLFDVKNLYSGEVTNVLGISDLLKYLTSMGIEINRSSFIPDLLISNLSNAPLIVSNKFSIAYSILSIDLGTI